MPIKIDFLVSCAAAIIFLFHCGVIGIAILGRLRPTWPSEPANDNAYAVLVMALGVGLAIDILTLLALGLSGLLTPVGIGAAGAGLFCLAVLLLRHAPLSIREASAGFGWFDAVIALALFFAIALTSLHPRGVGTIRCTTCRSLEPISSTAGL